MRRGLWTLAAAGILFVAPAGASAQQIQLTGPLDSAVGHMTPRLGRVELAMFLDYSPSRGAGYGGRARYWITDWAAVAAVGHGLPFDADQDSSFRSARAFRIAIPQTRYDWGVYLGGAFAPLTGKLVDPTGGWFPDVDLVVDLGLGAAHVQPIPMIDPEFRTFESEVVFAAAASGELRIHLAAPVALSIGGALHAAWAPLESLTVALGRERANEETWSDPSLLLTAAFRVAVTVFFPLERNWAD